MFITENQLDEWVRSNKGEAQGTIVELIGRLVAASCPRPRERRFHWKDSIGQHGPDGVLDTDLDFEPFVPKGKSFWEIGTGLGTRDKATSDYKKLTENVPENIRRESTFIFVTPLSGQREWEYTWKKDAQAAWLEDRRTKGEWKDVRVIDGTKLIDWLRQFPAIERWLARKMGLPAQQIDTPEERWEVLRTFGGLPLTPQVFLLNREDAYNKLKEVFTGKIQRLKLQTHFPDQIVDFVAACVATLDEETRTDVAGRCLVISGIEAWNAICEQYRNHILIAAPTIDLSGHEGVILLEKARRAGHSVIYGGLSGGIPEEDAVFLPQPKVYQLSKALEEAGYNEERARLLAQKSGGNLSTFLKLLQNLSLTPEWAQWPDAADLVIAVLLGAWNEKYEADRRVAETLSGKPYEQWIAKIRELALRPNTPLTYQDGIWKFIARYEGWYALGPRVFDEHLDRLRSAMVTVLREKDPKFDLPTDKRYAAQIYGKVLAHSQLLRNGLAESLALLGNHPGALTSASFGKAEATAILAAREILSDADWVLWASLNDVLPLLAEAAPNEFLDAVEAALRKTPCPFDELFAQETSGITSANYMTGVLWALETLAWDPDHLIRVVCILGALAARDPGGTWANRPANSLTTIFLPWLPQTCASVAKRRTAVATLFNENSDVAWKVLLSLLPESHSVSFGTRKPTWRKTIPDNWPKGVTYAEYWEQVKGYAEMAVKVAEGNVQRLVELIARLPDLPPSACDQLLTHLESEAILALPETDRLHLWNALADLVTKHRKFADTDWAMESRQVDRIEAIAKRLAPKSPALLHKRLFSERDFDLYEEKGDFEQQVEQLERRRQQAVQEIAETGGSQAVIDFAASVQSPWRVGFSFGCVATVDADSAILPDMLHTERRDLAQFVGGFVRGRLHSQGWAWVDKIDTSNWTPDQIGQFLSNLPFVPETWKRSACLLGDDELPYWKKTVANPYETQTGLELAVDKLIEYDRPFAAIRCLYRMLVDKQPLDSTRALSALFAALDSSESASANDTYKIVEIIKALQNDPKTNQDDLFRVEWAYLPLLEHNQDASPKLLERRLASDPDFFCEVIRLVFPSKNEDCSTHEPTEQNKNISANALRLLWNWKTPPGTRADGSYDGDALIAWLDVVKRKCSETGHLEIALKKVGHVLVYAPPDPDGLWIHRSAAAVLNSEDSEEMRVGFRIELFNSRGMHWVDPSGKSERKLAAKYRKQAEEIEAAGYYRLASTLKELAKEYDREAERILSRQLSEE
ncbi:hypothetical protein [Carboxydothermus hydrogenoformans]|uniref:Uncharacterized protein n=1 Tax=Carboxydothermus hydrogenoformans (strain ATCC BAA-161 / DSM 6008 / Z-2901) TaxID=246194 RepID=Q3ADV4_CARHZ|nr:hypothetical protein [Carboxydothermus hydrogenoformans]ABB16023.1 conserved hypothetical protein [Carboxydothermus hydrogenoformans Z-2901]